MDGYLGPDDDSVKDSSSGAPYMEHAAPQPGLTENAGPSGSAPPTTGDVEIDGVLRELAQAQEGSLSERIAAGERTHRALRDRLSDLGGQ